MTYSGLRARANSWVILASFPANDRPARQSDGAASPRQGTVAFAICLSRAHGPIGIRRGSVREAVPSGAGTTEGAGDRLEGADPADRPLSNVEWTGQEDNGGLHRDRPRTGRLHVGRCPGGSSNLIWSPQRHTSFAHGRRRGHGRGMPVRRFVAGNGRRPQ